MKYETSFSLLNEGSWRIDNDYINFETEEVRMVLVYLISMFLVPFFFQQETKLPIHRNTQF